MQAGLVLDPTVPVDPADTAPDSDLVITMLDGDLGAVAGSSGEALPRADAICYCDCFVCYAPPTLSPEAELG